MKSAVRLLMIALFGLLVTEGSYAYKNPWVTKSSNDTKSAAAACAAGAAFTDLWVNNVRCRINTGGDMWWDLQGVAKYFVPGNTEKTAMFSASLWIGGLDVNGQLKLAAQRYRGKGNDYWPGPLTIDGNANITADICASYDKHFRVTKAEVDVFRLWWEDKASDPGFKISKSILQWPGNGDESKGQSPYLAPFFDREPKNGVYDPENDGDYPYYDFKNELCKANAPTPETTEGIVRGGILADQVLKGDETIWWVFNDKGNLHSETTGSPIGLEIRAQAFGFSTNDEINSMTFYSYEIINRSTYRLTETYFSQWVDTDLGYAWDDYVGCDVKRGLGYCYNGNAIDGSGKADEYGVQPPAVGVDFFQGPYMDPDGLDNPKIGPDGKIMCDVSINGVNFDDGIIDNERFGMRRFVYHSNLTSGPTSDPEKAPEYYNFLRGIWKDGIKMLYGGNAHPNSGATGPACDFMFPELSDPCNWGTGGVQPAGFQTGAGGSGVIWTEANVGNPPWDRRFMQSAGPFTLEPGAVNYITVGIPWARATSGGPWGSVVLLKTVDDKCQKLFENCFKVLEGPDHPDLIVQELDREIILYLKNYKGSNNEFEKYTEIDPNIITPDLDSVTPGHDTIPGDTIQIWNPNRWDSTYKFQGYQIFQLVNATVTDLTNLDQARQVAQCDLKGDNVMTLINYEYNQELQANVPVKMVEGTDRGIQHSFVVTEDQFATGDKRLVNHKQYYFVAIAYGYNNYLPYSQDPNTKDGLLGQKKPYLIGRKQPKVQTAIPHINSPEANGTGLSCSYGDGPKITRIEGQGNGGLALDWTSESEDQLMQITTPPFIVKNPTYQNSRGPVNVKVIDPLNVKSGNYTIKFVPDATAGIDKAKWVLINNSTSAVDTSKVDISVDNEQLFLDLGLSIQIRQVVNPGAAGAFQNGYIESSISFADSSKIWFTGIPDLDNPGSLNWIRSGLLADPNNTTLNDWDLTGNSTNPGTAYDANEDFEKIVGRTWAPYNLTSLKEQDEAGPAFTRPSKLMFQMGQLASVDIVLTSDKSKWTRCPVIEMCPDKILSQGNAEKFDVRKSPSVDKNGKYAEPNSGSSPNAEDPNFIDDEGMGWFPGYAYNLETGERLNIAFGEDSWLVSENGRDMIFNPTDLDPSNPYYSTHVYSNLGKVLFGGKHYIYVFAHKKYNEPGHPELDAPAYDFGAWARGLLADPNYRLYAYASAMWVSIPMAVTGKEWLNNDARIKIRVGKPYARNYATPDIVADAPQNNNWPMYTFTTEDIATVLNDNKIAKSALDLINVVPNPYYGYSGYETDQLDNRVKITNLPEKCTVSIYSVNGTLVRQITKDAIKTSVDWDLKNYAGIPIASGVYIIHIKAPGIGEKVVKWFGVQRPVDLNAF
ncbi:MAG: T9SS type A sorting domain-containing protein [Bacteroidetes bacterium]|nr:T9SS type A sorting domain-containing protein [Bacteroidota bacterium]